MAEGTRMKQMESQLQQVATAMAEMQTRMGTLESSIGEWVDARIDQAMERWRGENREQSFSTPRVEQHL